MLCTTHGTSLLISQCRFGTRTGAKQIRAKVVKTKATSNLDNPLGVTSSPAELQSRPSEKVLGAWYELYYAFHASTLITRDSSNFEMHKTIRVPA